MRENKAQIYKLTIVEYHKDMKDRNKREIIFLNSTARLNYLFLSMNIKRTLDLTIYFYL